MEISWPALQGGNEPTLRPECRTLSTSCGGAIRKLQLIRPPMVRPQLRAVLVLPGVGWLWSGAEELYGRAQQYQRWSGDVSSEPG